MFKIVEQRAPPPVELRQSNPISTSSNTLSAAHPNRLASAQTQPSLSKTPACHLYRVAYPHKHTHTSFPVSEATSSHRSTAIRRLYPIGFFPGHQRSLGSEYIAQLSPDLTGLPSAAVSPPCYGFRKAALHNVLPLALHRVRRTRKSLPLPRSALL